MVSDYVDEGIKGAAKDWICRGENKYRVSGIDEDRATHYKHMKIELDELSFRLLKIPDLTIADRKGLFR